MSEAAPLQEMDVTPEIAQEWLQQISPYRHVANESARQRWVSRAAAEMSGGRWEPLSGVIWLDDEGRVLDGLIRLRAVVKSGVTIRSYVRRGGTGLDWINAETGLLRPRLVSKAEVQAARVHVLLNSDSPRVRELVAKAIRTNRAGDAADREAGFASPGDCPPEVSISTVIMALKCALEMQDWDCVAEAAVMAGDLHVRLQRSQESKPKGRNLK